MRLPFLRRTAGAASVLVAGALALTAPLTATSPARGADVTVRPGSGTITFSGHGYGHGRGMSQWGAYGAASVYGLGYRQILDFYYPGTTQASLSDSTIRVALSADTDGDTLVEPVAGLTVSSGGRSVFLPTGAEYRRWQATGTGPVVLRRLDAGGTWQPFDPGFALGTDVAFSATGGLLQVLLPNGVREELRGVVHATIAGGYVRTVLYASMESYLRGVVPNEMPASWSAQALAAQSVAARTYAAAYRERQRAAGSWYDICDTVSCQVFAGTAQIAGGVRTPREDSRSDAAIALTSTLVLRYNGALINAEFSSANGGWTSAGGAAYQVAKPDPYDGAVPNGSNTWSMGVSASALDGAFGIGTFRRMTILQRDGHGDLGGRVLQLRLDGDSGSATITGAQLRAHLGLKSDWFAAPSYSAVPRDFTGDGKADILARDPAGYLRLYPGDGHGGFTGYLVSGHGWGAMVDMLAAGNVDGVAGQDIIALRSDGTLYRYGGSGAGAWISQTQIGHGWSGYRAFVSPGDWNGDGRPDLVAINKSTGDLLLSTTAANGGLYDPVRIGTSWGAIDTLIAPGDFDGDGRPDLLARTRDGDLWLYAGSGTGGFRKVEQIGHGWESMAFVWSPGDVDGDGATDVLAIDSAGDLWLYQGNGVGGFTDQRQIGRGWTGLTPVR